MATEAANNILTYPDFSNNSQPPILYWFAEDDYGNPGQLTPVAGGVPVKGSFQGPTYVSDKRTALAAGDYVLYADIDAGAATTVTAKLGAPYSEVARGTLPKGTGRGRETVAIPFTLAEAWPATSIWQLLMEGDTVGATLYGLRLDTGTTPDTLGVFSGDTPDTEAFTYAWDGTAYLSQSTATAAAVIPDPEPEPEPGDTMEARAMILLGLDPESPEDVALTRESVGAIHMMVKSYTRGRGFNKETGTPADDLGAVILTASVRFMANPSGLSYRAGSETMTDAFKGWTLAETYVLNAYRTRSA